MPALTATEKQDLSAALKTVTRLTKKSLGPAAAKKPAAAAKKPEPKTKQKQAGQAKAKPATK